MGIRTIIDKSQWESFVTTSFPTSFFQSWNWGDFQKTLGNEIIRLGFFHDNKLFATALGVVIKAKRGKYFYIRNGPVSDWKNPKQSEFIIDALKKLAKKKKLWHVRISPHVSKTSQGGRYLIDKKFPVSPMSDVDALDTWILDLTQPLESIQKNMRKNTRY